MAAQNRTPETMQKQAEWQKKNTVMVTMRLQQNTDQDIIEFLGKADSRQGIIKTALREYIQNHSK